MIELSLVLSIGNSDYGNKVYRDIEPAVSTPEKLRTEYFLFTMRQAFRNIDYELIIVEWLGEREGEPPSEWGFIKDDRTRVIKVPYSFTQQVCPERPFHETHAKNIGIRRAKGRMVMGLNNDCLWLHEFSSSWLSAENEVIVANRPTVYATIMNVGLDIDKLKLFCSKPENIVHEQDLNSNGDFILMSQRNWFRLQGLSTPRGDALAGLDMWQVVRAEQLLQRRRLLYEYPIIHIRHPGAPLESSFGQTIVSDDWGFPKEHFIEF